MKRLKRNVIVTTALILAFITFFSMPVSAAEYINISDYLVDSSSESGAVSKSYYYALPSISSGFQFHGWWSEADGMKTSQNSTNGHNDEVFLTSDYYYYVFYIHPFLSLVG